MKYVILYRRSVSGRLQIDAVCLHWRAKWQDAIAGWQKLEYTWTFTERNVKSAASISQSPFILVVRSSNERLINLLNSHFAAKDTASQVSKPSSTITYIERKKNDVPIPSNKPI